MQINIEELSRLAHLSLTKEEIQRLREELASILDLMEQVDAEESAVSSAHSENAGGQDDTAWCTLTSDAPEDAFLMDFSEAGPVQPAPDAADKLRFKEQATSEGASPAEAIAANRLRPDLPVPFPVPERILTQVPDTMQGLIRVPAILRNE